MKVLKRSILIGAVIGLLAVIPALTASSTPKDVTVFSKDSTVLINEEVTSASVAGWIQKIRELDAKGPSDKPILLAVYSPGGDIVAGIDFIEGIKGTRRPLKSVTIFAASMAFQFVQNIPGDRLILKNGILMSHRARGGICESCEFGGQSPSQYDSRYQFWLSRLNELDQTTVDRSNGKQTLASYQKSYANEMWRTGSQSVAEGYADKVVAAACDASLSGTSKHTGSFMGMEVSYELSECPLITGPMNVSMTISSDVGPLPEAEFLAKGGRFDAYCLKDANKTNPCSLDTSLSAQKIQAIKGQFRTAYLAKLREVVYMSVK